MATLENKYTINHAMTVSTNDGALIEIADTLSQTNLLMKVLPFFPTNETLRHVTGRITSFGTPEAVVANEGAASIVNEHEQVIDTPIKYHNIIMPDPEALLSINDIGEWRADRVKEYGMSYAEAIADQVISGDSLTDPGKSIDGLAKRLGSLPTVATDVTDRYHTVRSAGGAGADNTSIYVVGLGKMGVHGLYSKNGAAGFQYSLGEAQYVNVGTAASPRYIKTRPLDVSWRTGLSATNHRMLGRVCNIDVSDLTDDASTGANLVNELTHMINSTRVNSMGLKPALLANETVISYFETQRINFGGNNVSLMTDLGMNLVAFKGIPFLQMDSIGVAEAVVS